MPFANISKNKIEKTWLLLAMRYTTIARVCGSSGKAARRAAKKREEAEKVSKRKHVKFRSVPEHERSKPFLSFQVWPSEVPFDLYLPFY